MSESKKALVIVESPTKARTIAGFLPEGFVVEASIGHVRDLPKSADEIPPEIKGEPWGRLAIDVERDFRPFYVVPDEKKKQVGKLKKLLQKADVLYLATDEDREGESISWHLLEVLEPRIPKKRLVFHEITREAIQEALAHPRDLDERLVKAQEARRILDRLYGYEISPLLWRKIAPKLSAGRVQSVTIRLVVERERERQRFVKSVYWDLSASFRTGAGASFGAQLTTVGGKRVARGKDFDATTGKLRGGGDVVLLDEQAARALVEKLSRSIWKVEGVERKPYTDKPAPPFTTSTLQQEANRKLRLSARAAMQAAQRLYESGYITYMRTDSTSLSEQAIARSRELIQRLYGREFLPAAPRQYRTKVKNAQEAHEAIRPSADFHRPEEIQAQLGEREAKLYELIWKRTMACQMADARGHRINVRVGDGHALFQASGKTIDFPGYLRAYVEGADDPDAELADKEVVLPDVREGEGLQLASLDSKSHTTQPPARFTEASLVKELETRGIGRPSTYASIIDTILQRQYVVKQGTALVPTFTAFAVVKLMEKHFAELVDVEFTARMEDDLDAISLGTKDAVPYLRDFYFGVGSTDGSRKGLRELLETEIDPRECCTIPLGKDAQGRGVDVRVGRYGPYVEREGERATVPEGLAPDELTLEKAEELLAKGSGPRELGLDPQTGKRVLARVGRYGPYVQLGESDDEPRMKSLLPGMDVDTVGLEEALQLLRLPRRVGVDPANGEEVFTDLGRYGPYVKRGTETRSLERPEDIFEIDLPRALEVLASQPERRGRRRVSQVLRELGPDPSSGASVRLLAGPYGPYVSDGTTNASLPKGAEPAELTMEAALELIRARAASGGKKRGAKKASKKGVSKKGGRKKASARKVTKKSSSGAQGATRLRRSEA